jgi:hypothetical protein
MELGYCETMLQLVPDEYIRVNDWDFNHYSKMLAWWEGQSQGKFNKLRNTEKYKDGAEVAKNQFSAIKMSKFGGVPGTVKERSDYALTLLKQHYDRLNNNAGYLEEESVNQGMAEGSEDPFGPQGRFVGDTGPTQVSTIVPRVQLRIGDRVLYKPTEQRATIEALSKDGTKARIHISSPMGGRTFNCRTADLKALGALKEKSTSQAQFRTMAAAAHDPKFARKVGIKQSVAQEFNKADRGQSYKSLPKKA